ncbi:GntR family transcriptional regulator [Sulfitobacter albidus]|uniref:GntR family transcriptional regulator n=1 Tax=Sulfitobacter albidus TaxID=2829501 RepID=A0A975JFN2_9RHOB|nr:GntR family transcriptional regulator [Sulfitobacter albidus]QUJ77336.1 GntR family transcriptional regulator [Sulfitobacter albidus]
MTTLHQELASTLLDRIETRELRVGDKLPPEAQYAAELGVSRSTLRLAYSELERLGVLQRRKRAGTTIIADKPKAQFNMSTAGLHELLSLGRDTNLALSGTRTVPTAEIEHLQGFISEADHWLEISGTRTLSEEDVPFNTTQIYVPARFAGIAHSLSDTEPSIFRKIEEHFDLVVGRVSQTAQAIRCPSGIAKVLGLEPDAPALRIVAQLYDRDGILIEVSIATFDPDRFQLRTDVRID